MKNRIKLAIGFILIATSMSSAQNTKNIFSYTIGLFEISLLSEGQQNGKSSILIGATSGMIGKYAPEGTFPNAMNAFLVRTPSKNILIDTGLGSKLFDNLDSLGISSDNINVVLITHMHGDHIGGMLRDGKMAFPNAEIYLPQPEFDYWMSDKAMNLLPENKRSGFLNARKVIDTYRNQLHLFIPDQLEATPTPLIPGFQGIAAYGHTPGHTVYMVESEHQQFLIWADLTHAMAIQMPHPEVAVTYDYDPKQAIESRKQILKYVSKNKIPVAGMHIAFPAMGDVTVDPKGGYLFTEKQ